MIAGLVFLGGVVVGAVLMAGRRPKPYLPPMSTDLEPPTIQEI